MPKDRNPLDPPSRGQFKEGPYIWMRLENPNEMHMFEVACAVYEKFDFNEKSQQ